MHFKFLALVVDLAGARQGWFGLPLKKRVVQDLIVDVHAAHLRRYSIALLRRDLLLFVGLLDGAPNLLDTYKSEGEMRIDTRIVLVCGVWTRYKRLDHAVLAVRQG